MGDPRCRRGHDLLLGARREAGRPRYWDRLEPPAFRGITLIQENFTPDPDGDDRHGHGTHCAGTIFGRDVDGERIGVARGVETALIGKVLDRHGRGSTAGVLRGMQWAEDQGANVISLSLGFDFIALVESLENEAGMARPAAISSRP